MFMLRLRNRTNWAWSVSLLQRFCHKPGWLGVSLALGLSACQAPEGEDTPTPADTTTMSEISAETGPSASGTSAETAETAASARNLLIMGQDMGAIRGYLDSDCCVQPDGYTEYLSFYALADESKGFGNLGIDLDGEPDGRLVDGGAGAMNTHMAAALDPNAFLVIGLSLTENEAEGVAPGALQRIADGAYDAEIDRLSQLFSVIDNPVLLRIGYEFEGVWNVGYENSPAYRAAYRRIAERVRAARGDQVQFVWQTSASPIDDVIDGRRDTIEDWYPGDDVVDWMGLSWFLTLDENAPAQPEPVTTQRSLIDEMMAFADARDKPVLIAEASPQGFDLANGTNRHIVGLWDGPSGEGRVEMSGEAIWDAWFQPLFDYMEEHPRIQGLAYINQNWDGQDRWGPPYTEGYWGDTRIEVNDTIIVRWNEAITAWKAPTDTMTDTGSTE